MNFFVGGFAALVLGLVSGIYVLAGLGFVAMLVTLTIMQESITEKESKRLCSWRGRTLSE